MGGRRQRAVRNELLTLCFCDILSRYCNKKHNIVQKEHPFDGYYKELYNKCCCCSFLLLLLLLLLFLLLTVIVMCNDIAQTCISGPRLTNKRRRRLQCS